MMGLSKGYGKLHLGLSYPCFYLLKKNSPRLENIFNNCKGDFAKLVSLTN